MDTGFVSSRFTPQNTANKDELMYLNWDQILIPGRIFNENSLISFFHVSVDKAVISISVIMTSVGSLYNSWTHLREGGLVLPGQIPDCKLSPNKHQQSGSSSGCKYIDRFVLVDLPSTHIYMCFYNKDIHSSS